MKTVYHAANSRGHANHGWLDTHHTFSFASYFDPKRTHFGALRVLNDDIVAGGAGFGTHPHENMEIISIPLAGELEHKDSMGNGGVIKTGDVQVMSAGTGIQHSEFNPDAAKQVNFLQVWVFPKEKGIKPTYGQKTFAAEERQNTWQTLVSPEEDGNLTIHQDAYFHLANLTKDQKLTYQLHGADKGVYFFVLEGSLKVGEQVLNKRDGLGVYEAESVELTASADSEILAIEVPMTV